MDRKRKLALVVATVAVAMGVGHFLQGGLNGEASRSAGLSSQPKGITPLAAGLGNMPSAATALPGEAAPEDGPRLPADAMAPDESLPAQTGQVTDSEADLPDPVAPPISAPAISDNPVAEGPAEAPLFQDPPQSAESVQPPEAPETPEAGMDPSKVILSGDSINCPIDLQLLPAEAATLSLSLLAPCRASERVVIRHGGLAFTAQTSLIGGLAMSIPGMEISGAVTVRFEDGSEAHAAADLPDLPIYQRFAVQWMAQDTFEIHAFENGAGRNAPGHVSAANPQRRLSGVPTRGGDLTLLGDDSVALPMLAEVYTWPLDPAMSVEVQVETVVSDATCGRDLLGELLLSQAGAVDVTDLTMATPACDAIGDVLVLNNPVADMKLALTD